MRLLIRLRCTEDGQYEMQYHYHLQGFIYKLLEGSKYHYVHDKDGYKFFCFSNIFPAYDLRVGESRTLIVSSPNGEFIEYLKSILSKPWNQQVTVGKMKFSVEHVDEMTIRLPDAAPYSLITGTPIVVRIPKEKYLMHGIAPRHNYEYLYWRSEYPLELFTSRIESNLINKYRQYCNENGLTSPRDIHNSMFQKFKFKKQISTRVFMKDSEQIIIGTVWEFFFEGWEDKALVQFALDTGLGERNSLGFGFMNLARNKGADDYFFE